MTGVVSHAILILPLFILPIRASDDHPTVTQDPRQIRIAWLAPFDKKEDYSAETSVNALKLAVRIAKKNYLTNKVSEILVKWYDSKCSAKAARTAALFARYDLDPDLILGPPCSAGMKEVAALASQWNLPVFSWADNANDLDLQDRSTYTSLVRVFPPLHAFASTVDYLSFLFRWRRYSVIYDTREQYKTVGYEVSKYLMDSNNTFASSHSVNENLSDAEIRRILQVVRRFARIILMSVPWMSMRRYMLIAQELNMTNGEFAFVCFNGIVHSQKELNRYVLSDAVWRRDDADDALAKTAFESVIHIVMDTSILSFTFNRLNYYSNRAGKVSSPNFDLPITGKRNIGVSAAFLYDATVFWAYYANTIMMRGGDIRNGSHMVDTIRYAELKGVTGPINMDRNADRLTNVWILDMDAGGIFRNIVRVEKKAGGSAHFRTYRKYKFRWPNGLTGSGNAPIDTPLCGFRDELC